MQNKPAGIIILLLLFTLTLSGQKKVNSPYHRFNIGGLSQAGSFRSLAMGGSGIAMRDNNSIYFRNPASYTSLDTTSFVFDFGLDLGSYALNDGSSRHVSFDVNFNHLLMGFPIKKRFGIGIGIVPVSNGYYYISEKTLKDDPEYDPSIGEIVSLHRGDGNISDFFIGTGYKITKNISLGVNMNVTLGEIERLNQFEFADYANSFNQRGIETFRIGGVNLDYGIQYATEIKKDYFMTAGFSFTGSRKYTTSKEILKERFAIYSSWPYSPDTLYYYYNRSNDSTTLPRTLRAGLSFGKKDVFTAEINYIYTGWAGGMIHGDNSHLGNTQAWTAGIEYIPEKYSNTSFLKRMEYRLGFHYADNYLVLNGIQLKEYGASAGFAIRMRNSLSKAAMYFDFTRRKGELSAGMPDENIYSFGISLNLYDRWFIKKKFD